MLKCYYLIDLVQYMHLPFHKNTFIDCLGRYFYERHIIGKIIATKWFFLITKLKARFKTLPFVHLRLTVFRFKVKLFVLQTTLANGPLQITLLANILWSSIEYFYLA